MRQLGVVVILGILAATLPAQDYRAKLTGEVLDASGAPTPKVRVELTNKASLVTVSTVSNQAGVYLFQFLDSGDYKLTAASAGFKTFVQDGLRLHRTDHGDRHHLAGGRHIGAD